jgi:3-oxoacyl-[acyl-carrier protein] reductase
MDLGLRGKYALVSGGTNGIGRSIVLDLAKEGCNVCFFSRTEERVKRMMKELEDIPVEKIGMCADALNNKDIEKVIEKVNNTWGGVDILVNNVGGGGRWGKEIVEDTDYKVWQEVYDKNAGLSIKLTMWAIPNMRKQKWGRVITIASILGKEGGGRPWFNMAKAAEISLMKTLAKTSHLVKDGITFNTVAPGGILIPGTGWEQEQKEYPEKFKDFVNFYLPLGRMGTSEEVSFIVLCICSVNSSLLNGACIAVDGGESRSF